MLSPATTLSLLLSMLTAALATNSNRVTGEPLPCPALRIWALPVALGCAAQVFDGYLVKYCASTVALLMYAAPLYMRKRYRQGSQVDLTQDYIRAMRLLQNTSRCAETQAGVLNCAESCIAMQCPHARCA
jgi:hypothetical protein